MRAFLSCLGSAAEAEHAACRQLSKEYLQCRMQNNLMAQEDLRTLGFAPEGQPEAPLAQPERLPAARGEERIAGMASSKRKTGFIFGLGGGSSGRTAGHG
jgi:cytochrome c oxidase assembly protein subunit 19